MNRGFTLIELMVSISIFSVVMVTSIGAVLSIADANRKAHSLRSVMDNLNFALESMARNMRTGTMYTCGSATPNVGGQGTNCPSGGNIVSFVDQSGTHIAYRVNETDQSIERLRQGDASWMRITAPDVLVENSVPSSPAFIVTGATSDNKQPRILIVIKGRAGTQEELQSEFVVQSTVSQRRLDK